MNLVTKTYAAFGDIFSTVKNGQNAGSTSLSTVIQNVINIVLVVAGALAVIYLIYSGILYITAAGNPDSAKKGQQGIINAVIGIIIIAAAYLIIGAALKLGTSATTGGGTL